MRGKVATRKRKASTGLFGAFGEDILLRVVEGDGKGSWVVGARRIAAFV
jgi:hypothetical protein